MTATEAQEALGQTRVTEFGGVFDGRTTAVGIADQYALDGILVTASASEKVGVCKAFIEMLVSARGPPRGDQQIPANVASSWRPTNPGVRRALTRANPAVPERQTTSSGRLVASECTSAAVELSGRWRFVTSQDGTPHDLQTQFH